MGIQFKYGSLNEMEIQTPIDEYGIFTEVSRSSRFPLVLVGAPRNGQAPAPVTL
jgi:hypothetical protein